MDLLRTPDSAFDVVVGFDHPWRHPPVVDEEGHEAQMAVVEAGPREGEPVLLLHGEPTWSFLYRDVITELLAAGHRVLAPDLIGFGRSDKPTEVSDHTYGRHLAWLSCLVVDRLDLSGITLVGQDWGGLLGLRLAAAHPDRVARIVAANTGLPTGDHAMPEVWWRMREVVRTAPHLDIGRAVDAGCKRRLTDEERAAYAAPFPDPAYLAGPRAMPGLVPVTPEDPETVANRAAWAALTASDTPFAVMFSDGDPITGAMAGIFSRVMPGARGNSYPPLSGGHFLQEDAGAALGRQVVDFIDRT